MNTDQNSSNSSAPSATAASASGRPIRFFHRGDWVSVDSASTTTTVLGWLREHAHCTGTKEGCNEGDCGACTVLVASLPASDAATAPHPQQVAGLVVKPVNACIHFLGALDGKALLTVEDLTRAASPQPLHPVQQALRDCHGSQCGFCTPGFAMSLASTYEHHVEHGTRPTRQDLANDLAGNLCRCTGYRPIIDAGQRMFDLPSVRFDWQSIQQALSTHAAVGTLDYVVHEQAFNAPRRLMAPRSADELAALRVAHPQARLVAGATDVALWTNKAHRDLGDVIHVGAAADLQQIDITDSTIRIGAAVSLEDAWRALSSEYPELTEVWLRFASPPVRHAGTLVGNLANGSPIGDGAPVLIALDSVLVLRRGDRVRRLPLGDFYVDYMKNRLEAGEFVQAVEVPRRQASDVLRVYKVSKRFDSDISAVLGAFRLRLHGEVVDTVRLVFGGMAAIVRRSPLAEQALEGQVWSEDAARSAMSAVAQDFSPLTDMRASASYRARIAQNLLYRFWLETRPHDPLPAEAVSVWQPVMDGAGEGAA